VGSFGEHLRREREKRGIPLDQIVATTKIGRRLLLALEEEQFDLLPGGIFNKAYVRAYAKCVGIDEEEAVSEYLEAAKEPPADTRVIAQQHASIHSDRPRESASFPFVPVLVLLLIVAGGVAGWKARQDHRRQREAHTATGALDIASPVASTSLATGTAPRPRDTGAAAAASAKSLTGATQSSPDPSAGKSSVVGTAFELTIRPTGRAWVSVKSDGRYVIRGILKPEEIKTVRATREVVFYTGNAGALELSFNGKNVPLAGGSNEEKVLVFDSTGLTGRTAAP